MKILHLNGADIEGGAAKAATRLLQGLRGQGADARLYVQRKTGSDPLVNGPRSIFGKAFGYARPTLEQLLCGIKPGKLRGPFCAALLSDGLGSLVREAAPDIVHLHWVARMMRLETLRSLNVPVVWTLHDSWPFTGGCYLPFDCTRFRESCGSCPVLGAAVNDDLSRRIWRRKRQAWRELTPTLVAPSHWMAEAARSSSLFSGARVEVIPNGLDTALFAPCDKREARKLLSLPQERKLVLFGAKSGLADRNKGFHLLVEALRELAAGPLRDHVDLVVFGSSEPEQRQEFGFRTHYLGWQGDETRLARVYAAADVFVFPSIQESLGYTAMEAMACGTPCVAFRQGGVPDLVDHQQNGYLAAPFEPSDLARGIAWILEGGRGWELSQRGREKVEENFALEKIAARHLALYRELSGKE
jgi:glycosyltransferase involved in cell wall biosynthesis